MEIRTVLFILLAAIAALAVVFYQYFYKNPKKNRLSIYLGTLRFIAIFCGLLLLINPKFTKKEFFLEKSNLIVLVDDSESMLEGNNDTDVANIINKINDDEDLRQRFSLHQYAFGPNLYQTDSLNFSKKNTDISKALLKVDEIFANGTSAVVLLSDGNQTIGRDYDYLDLSKKLSINTVVVGDTTTYDDISVGTVNLNKYAFLKNKFPVEATILYQGSRPVSKTMTISINGTTVHRENVSFGSNENSKLVSTVLEAKSVGVKSVKITIGPLENERNVENNSKETAIEVINEKTNVLIISDIPHPDIGALKKSIEVNEQRVVKILKPSVPTEELEEADIIIIYQPNNKFKNVYQHLGQSRTNTFTIVGTKTDWVFLNAAQQRFTKEFSNQTEEIIPTINKAFGIFGLADFSVSDFPPLAGNLGDIVLNENGETLLFQKIRGVTLDKPLLTVFSGTVSKEAVLFGENLWKWRSQSYRNYQSFQNFDDFIGKLMVYLTSNEKKSRLELDYELVFDSSNRAKIRGLYFDQSYTFDSNANLKIAIQGVDTDFSREAPMLLRNTFYQVDLADLESGEYSFTVTEENENLQRSGSFKILDFNPEKQLISSNYKKLDRLVESTNGKQYFTDGLEALLTDLGKDDRYVPLQKSKQNVVSLIDFQIVLVIIAIALAVEWFIRKYNGLT